MNWIGKLTGGVIGWLVGGVPGALLGHLIDAYRRRYTRPAFGRNRRALTQDTFLARRFPSWGVWPRPTAVSANMKSGSRKI
jgi:hypothetical protein